MSGQRAVFLDRDGTLIREADYLRDPSGVVLERDAAEAVALLNRAGYRVILVSNQSGIARGYYTERELEAVQRRVEDLLHEEGAYLDAFYFCPHHPDGRVEKYRMDCRCRKPGTGMVERAVEEWGIDLAASYVIGDKASDLEMARRAGMTAILVRTGYGEETWEACLTEAGSPRPDRVAEDVGEAVRFVLALEDPAPPIGERGAAMGGSPPGWSCKWVSLPLLLRILERHRERGRTVVLANGVFDLLHAGHVRYLQAAKAEGDLLVVALNDDRSVRRLKGAGRPILPLKDRLELVSGLACVDYCLAFGEATVDRLVEAIRPEVHAKGRDYTETSVPEGETVRRCGGRVRIVGPPKERATSGILERVRASEPPKGK